MRSASIPLWRRLYWPPPFCPLWRGVFRHGPCSSPACRSRIPGWITWAGGAEDGPPEFQVAASPRTATRPPADRKAGRRPLRQKPAQAERACGGTAEKPPRLDGDWALNSTGLGTDVGVCTFMFGLINSGGIGGGPSNCAAWPARCRRRCWNGSPTGGDGPGRGRRPRSQPPMGRQPTYRWAGLRARRGMLKRWYSRRSQRADWGSCSASRRSSQGRPTERSAAGTGPAPSARNLAPRWGEHGPKAR